MRELLLGIDIGTSACKVAAFDANGRVAAAASRPYPVYYPHPGYAEQDPDAWWKAVCGATRALFSEGGICPEEIRGIGVDGQSWSAIAVDKDGAVLARNPIWLDTRAAHICDRLKERYGDETFFSVSGNSLQPFYTTGKILWYKEKMPEVCKRTCKILQCNSFIVYRLTGMLTQDVSQGYGLHCFDMRTARWDDEMCRLLGIPARILPEIYPCHQVVGGVTKEAAEATGLLEHTPVVAGGLDACCGTLGAGVICDGETQEQGGQAGGMSVCIGTYRADPRLILGYHVVPGKWLLQGGTTGGGGAMRWFEQEFGGYERLMEERTKTSSLDQLGSLAEGVPAGSDGVIFLPYMAGERSPIWDPDAKGVFYGLDFNKTKGHFVRALMEGVAFSLKHNIDIAAAAGAPVGELRAIGGSANSRLWTQIKADVTGRPIAVPSSDTATTQGAAILAGVGVGLYKSFEEAVSRCVQLTRRQMPDPDRHAAYQKNYATYLRLYEQLKGLMDAP